MKQKQPQENRQDLPAAISSEIALYLGLVPEAKFRQLLGISESTARRWRQIGIFPFIKIENKVFYRLEDLRKILEDHFYKNKPYKYRR